MLNARKAGIGPRIIVILAASLAVACAAGTGPGGDGGASTTCGPGTNDAAGNGVCVLDLPSLSQLNAIWSLSGTFAFDCNGVPESEALSGVNVYVFNGAFNEPQISLPTGACGIFEVKFQGAIGQTGAISGNFATDQGNPVLSDTLTGSCSATSCTGHTASSGLFSFTLTNTMENPFDGSTWQVLLTCSDGVKPALAIASIDNGGTLQLVGGGSCTGATCIASGSMTPSEDTPYTLTGTGTVTAGGGLTAMLSQGAAGSVSALSFDPTTGNSLTSLKASGTFGSTISLTPCSTAEDAADPCEVCANTR